MEFINRTLGVHGLSLEISKLSIENKQLRKKLGLMEDNITLRCTLRNLEDQFKELLLSPLAKQSQPSNQQSADSPMDDKQLRKMVGLMEDNIKLHSQLQELEDRYKELLRSPSAKQSQASNQQSADSPKDDKLLYNMVDLMEDNIKLHSTLQDLEDRYKELLQSPLAKQSQASNQQSADSPKDDKQIRKMVGLMEDNIKLHSKLQELEDHYKELLQSPLAKQSQASNKQSAGSPKDDKLLCNMVDLMEDNIKLHSQLQDLEDHYKEVLLSPSAKQSQASKQQRDRSLKDDTVISSFGKRSLHIPEYGRTGQHGSTGNSDKQRINDISIKEYESSGRYFDLLTDDNTEEHRILVNRFTKQQGLREDMKAPPSIQTDGGHISTKMVHFYHQQHEDVPS